LSGVKKYIERGDIFQIEDLEMFILNSLPENGFITNETNVIFKFGLNKEKCLEKIHNADNKFALGLINADENNSESHERRINDLLIRNLFNHSNNRNTIGNSLNSGYENANMENILLAEHFGAEQQLTTIIQTLPTLKVDDTYLKYLDSKTNEEGMKKCVICMELFDLQEVLKTLPCFHVFHNDCITEWLANNNQCPICKCSVQD